MADRLGILERRRHWAYSLALMPVVAIIQFSAYWLRFEGQLSYSETQVFWSTLTWVVLIKTAAFAWFGVYQSWNSYVSFHDLISLIKATTLSCILLAMGDYLFMTQFAVPR